MKGLRFRINFNKYNFTLTDITDLYYFPKKMMNKPLDDPNMIFHNKRLLDSSKRYFICG
jgi:hypothetical protein